LTCGFSQGKILIALRNNFRNESISEAGFLHTHVKLGHVALSDRYDSKIVVGSVIDPAAVRLGFESSCYRPSCPKPERPSVLEEIMGHSPWCSQRTADRPTDRPFLYQRPAILIWIESTNTRANGHPRS